jgi:hypothetical protein
MRRPKFRVPVTMLAAVCGVASCGSNLPPPAKPQSYLPNIAQIQAALTQAVLAHDHVKVTALCPAVVPQIKGETFSCIAFSRGQRRTFTFLVTEHGGTYVTYRQTG